MNGLQVMWRTRRRSIDPPLIERWREPPRYDMSQQHILIAEGVLATVVPLARGWRVIQRLKRRGVHPFFKVQGAGLLIFFGKKQDVGGDATSSGERRVAVDNAELMRDWIVGRIR